MSNQDIVSSFVGKLSITPEIAENLVKAGFSSIESFKGARPEDLKSIEKVGDVTAERIIDKANVFILESEKKALQSENSTLRDELAPIPEGRQYACFGSYCKIENYTEKCSWCHDHVDCKAEIV